MNPHLRKLKDIAAQVANRHELRPAVMNTTYGLRDFLVDEIADSDSPAEIAVKALRYFLHRGGHIQRLPAGRSDCGAVSSRIPCSSRVWSAASAMLDRSGKNSQCRGRRTGDQAMDRGLLRVRLGVLKSRPEDRLPVLFRPPKTRRHRRIVGLVRNRNGAQKNFSSSQWLPTFRKWLTP